MSQTGPKSQHDINIAEQDNVKEFLKLINKAQVPPKKDLSNFFNYWNKQFEQNKTDVILQQMNQILIAINKMESAKQQEFAEIASRISDFIKEKFTKEFLDQNKDFVEKNKDALRNIVNILNTIPTAKDRLSGSFIVEQLKLQDVKPEPTPAAEPPISLTATASPSVQVSSLATSVAAAESSVAALKNSSANVSDTAPPTPPFVPHQRASQAQASTFRVPTDAIITAASSFKNLSVLKEHIETFIKATPQLQQNIKLQIKDPNDQTAELIYKNSETAQEKAVAKVNLNKDQVQYTLNTSAFNSPDAPNPLAAVPAPSAALISTIIVAAGTGPIKLSGGNVSQALQICAAVKEASAQLGKPIKFEINSTNASILNAVQASEFSDFLRPEQHENAAKRRFPS